MARRKHREGQELHKVLGVPALFSTVYGNVGSSIYYALGIVSLYALGATPLVFLVTGLLFITTAWTYAEATAALPEAGGASSFARRAFNEMVSFGIGWGQMLVYVATIAISALFVPHYLSVFWPILLDWPYNAIGGILTAVLLMVINVIGLKEAARLNIMLALLDLVTQVLIMLIALVLLLQPRLLIDQIQWGIAPTWKDLLYGMAIGTVAYTGIETLSNMAEEATDPGRTIPRSINYVIVVVLVVYIGMPLAGLSAMNVGSNYVPVERDGDDYVIPEQEPKGDVIQTADGPVTELYGTQLGSNYVEDPVLGLVRFLPDEIGWLKAILGPWVGILAATILVIATNAGLIGVSRLTYSLGQHRQLPPMLGRMHAKRLTPYVSIIVFGSIAAVLMIPGSTGLLADLYIFGSMISFTAAHLSVIVLRFKEPGLERPWRPPLNIPIRGTSVPVTSVIGALGTFSVWLVIVAFQGYSRIIGFAWLGAGLLMYVVYRRAKGYPLTRTVPRTSIPITMQADIDYDQILVPIVGSRITDEMMVLACQLATEKQSALYGLYVIEVPMNLPLDARLVDEREKAGKVLAAAGLIASQFKVKFTPVVITARSAGRAIVDEATTRRSEVIILGSVKKRRVGDRVFGRTVDYVLQHTPCEVIVNLVPRDYPTEGSADGDESSPPVASGEAATNRGETATNGAEAITGGEATNGGETATKGGSTATNGRETATNGRETATNGDAPPAAENGNRSEG